MTMTQAPAPYRTSDIALAAALISLGHRLLGVTGNGGPRFTFEFPDSPEVRAAALGFLNRSLRIEPRGFSETLKTLKVSTRQT